jgi:hypothetical protein
MLKQGVLPFSYECEPTESGMTALAGLPVYLELASIAKLPDSLQRHLEGCHLKQQGWTDTQIIMSLILLNIAGGDCVDDLRILEQDEGLVRIIQKVDSQVIPAKNGGSKRDAGGKNLSAPFPRLQ